jgi:hypothetical protein
MVSYRSMGPVRRSNDLIQGIGCLAASMPVALVVAAVWEALIVAPLAVLLVGGALVVGVVVLPCSAACRLGAKLSAPDSLSERRGWEGQAGTCVADVASTLG